MDKLNNIETQLKKLKLEIEQLELINEKSILSISKRLIKQKIEDIFGTTKEFKILNNTINQDNHNASKNEIKIYLRNYEAILDEDIILKAKEVLLKLYEEEIASDYLLSDLKFLKKLERKYLKQLENINEISQIFELKNKVLEYIYYKIGQFQYFMLESGIENKFDYGYKHKIKLNRNLSGIEKDIYKNIKNEFIEYSNHKDEINCDYQKYFNNNFNNLLKSFVNKYEPQKNQEFVNFWFCFEIIKSKSTDSKEIEKNKAIEDFYKFFDVYKGKKGIIQYLKTKHNFITSSWNKSKYFNADNHRYSEFIKEYFNSIKKCN